MSFRGDFQVVEVGHGVSFCPEADLACILERVIRGLDLFVAVVIAGDLAACDFNSQLVPLAGRDLQIRAGELAPSPIDHVIEPVVVLQGVGANDVVVVRIAKAEDQTACPIDTPRTRFESNTQIEVPKRSFICDE